jgi:hypothetical protein
MESCGRHVVCLVAEFWLFVGGDLGVAACTQGALMS